MRVKPVCMLGVNPAAKAEPEPDRLGLALRVALEGDSRAARCRACVRS